MAFSDIVVSGQNGFLVESPDELVKALEGYRVDDMLAKEQVLRGGLLRRSIPGHVLWSR